MRLGMRWPYVSCKTLDKNERVLLGIWSLAGSYRWQSPVVRKTVFSQSPNGSDFRGSRGGELLAVASAPSCARLFICHLGRVSGCAGGAWPPCYAGVHTLLAGAVGGPLGTLHLVGKDTGLCHVLAAFTCCVASLGRPAQTVLLKSNKGRTGTTYLNRHLFSSRANQ